MTKSNKKLLVEVGPGTSPREGYVHCDIRPKKHVEYICNAWAIPFERESVPQIYARHILEHLTLNQAKRTLAHWFCVLEVGGMIDINVPDLEKHIQQLSKQGDSPYLERKVSNEEHAMAGLYGWQDNDYDVHKWGYTFRTLSQLLSELGYSDIKQEEDSSQSGYLNLRVTAKKEKVAIGLKRDPESLKPRWFYYNWPYSFYRVGRFLNRIIKRITREVINFPKSFINIFKKDYSSRGERQAAKSLTDIREDHTGRYRLACKFIERNSIVLDCACGVGYGSFILARESKAGKVLAFDKEKKAIEFAKKYYAETKITHEACDIFSSRLPEHYFDCIVSFETLEHVNGEALLDLFSSKLKRKGLLLISTPNQERMPFNKKQFPFHLRHYTPSEFEALLTKCDFEIVERFTQNTIDAENVLKGWNGLFNIAVARKV